MLDSEEAARRLGVKLPTLYAYVSRGLLPSHRGLGSKRSFFEIDDVERLAQRSRGGRRVETRLATITTAVTQLRENGPAYRGHPAITLARSATYEEVADLLWRAEQPADGPWRQSLLGRPPNLGTSDLLRWVVLMAGSADTLRSDARPEAIIRAARRIVATMVSVVPGPGGASPQPQSEVGAPDADTLARRLARRLAPNVSGELVEALNAELVLLADHELATSTVAVRVAASTRADLYDALLAGLGTLAGPLHGGASLLAHKLLMDAEQFGAERALDETLRWQGVLPGFGHTVYKEGDPRFGVLLELFDRLANPTQRRLVRSIVALAADHRIPEPNVDLGLAAISMASGMAPDAGRTIFTIARVAGWTAHYIEELQERPLRFRARAVYASAESPGPTWL